MMLSRTLILTSELIVDGRCVSTLLQYGHNPMYMSKLYNILRLLGYLSWDNDRISGVVCSLPLKTELPIRGGHLSSKSVDRHVSSSCLTSGWRANARNRDTCIRSYFMINVLVSDIRHGIIRMESSVN